MNVLSWCKNYIFSWAILMTVSVLGTQCRSWEIVDARKLKVSAAADTVLLCMVMGVGVVSFES